MIATSTSMIPSVVLSRQTGDVMVDSDDLRELIERLSAENRQLVGKLVKQLAGEPQESPELHFLSCIPLWVTRMLRDGKSGRTVKDYVYHVATLLRTFPHPDTELIDAYLSFRQNQVSPAYIALATSAIKSFFGFLYESGRLKENPAQRFRHPRLEYKQRPIPSREDIVKLLTCPQATLRDQVMILLMTDCGLRLSELCNLHVSDMSLSECYVTVLGKGNKQRTVPMSIETRDVIRKYLPQSDYLFPGYKGHPINISYVDGRFRELCDHAGIKRITPHQLRHFCASAMLNDGANPAIVSKILGHASLTTTSRIYHHVDDQYKRREHHEHPPLRGIT